MSLPERLSMNIRPVSAVVSKHSAGSHTVRARPLRSSLTMRLRTTLGTSPDIGKANRARPAHEIDVVHDSGARAIGDNLTTEME